MALKNLCVFIPTYRRVDKQRTYDCLPDAIKRHTYMAVSADERDAIAKRCPLATVITVPNTVTCIAEKRAWIIQQSPERKIIMLDDDMEFHARCDLKLRSWTDEQWKPQPGVPMLTRSHATDQIIIDGFKQAEKLLDKFPHGGFGSRQGNHLVEESITYTGRMMHAIGYDVTVAKQIIEFNRVKVREDFDYTLQMLRSGKNNFILHDLVVSPGSYGAPGGASEERTLESSDFDAEKLAELHPGFVTVVQRDYKNVPRKEVVVRWKKAFESSKPHRVHLKKR